MTQFYHWLGREAEAHHDELPAGMFITLPSMTDDPTQDELG